MDLPQMPTFEEYYDEWCRRFEEAGVSEPEESTDLIFAHFLGFNDIELVPDEKFETRMTEVEMSNIRDSCSKRLRHIPTQYITGECFFHGIMLKMRPPVFIPSVYETELLVDHALNSIMELINKQESESEETIKILDMGCGSGAVSLSLLKILKDKPVEFVAIDAAPHAITLMNENAERLLCDNTKKKLKILQHTIDKNDDVISKMGPFDVIVGNVPYIPTCDMRKLSEEIKKHEDLLAYHGGEDGTCLIDIILTHARNWLSERGSIWFEIDPSQPQLLSDRYSDYWSVTSYKDRDDVWRFSHFIRK